MKAPEKHRDLIMPSNFFTASITRYVVALAILLMLAACGPALRSGDATAAGRIPASLPAGDLKTPEDSRQRAYLGIESGPFFRLQDIQADILLVEVFDFYCPHCQREAPNVNRLYRHIAADPELKARIKVIGIGVGNTSYEVNRFAEIFDVPFPLFPDRSRRYARQLAVHRTPTFIGFSRAEDGNLQQILHMPGSLGDVAHFLDHLLELAASGGKPPDARVGRP
jgi:peroxiredoxin